MTITIKANDCIQLLNGESSKRLLKICNKIIKELTFEEQFTLAKGSLKELESFSKRIIPLSNPTISGLYSTLILSFQNCDSITWEEYDWLLNNAGTKVINSLMKNPSFPMDFLVNNSWLDSHTKGADYFLLRSYISSLRMSRKIDFINCCKSLVPGSEHMTDDIVLKVVGV